jgi:hypothetical protein
MDPIVLAGVAAATRRNGGATVDAGTGALRAPDDRWYFPRYPDLTAIVPPAGLEGALGAFVEHHRGRLASEGLLLGTWIRPATGHCYLDLITSAAGSAEALVLARRFSRLHGRRILAVCNPLRGRTLEVWADEVPEPAIRGEAPPPGRFAP